MLAVLSLLLLSFCGSVRGVFQQLYCTLSDSCDCDFRPNIRGLEWDLYKNVFGQHLAQDVVSEEVARFLANKSPDRPLVLSFHGSSGTGKTLVSSMLANHLYGSAMSSPYVHQFVPTLHFPSPHLVHEYREELKSWVQGNLTECARSVFIFDEMEKMPPGVIDVLEPFLGPAHVVFRTNYRKAIYVFISTTGQELIKEVTLQNRLAGREREDIKLSALQDRLAQAVYNDSTSGFFQSSIVQQRLVTVLVPFLPLSRCHVERCVHSLLCQTGSCQRSDVVEAVGGDMTYAPAQGQYFSTTGCKAVAAKVNFFL
ncbi:torsin-2A-like [Salarias fasciatus]|uniref:Torsin family 2 member A n=1 Tax=Salarias fasciatus TaxID=181472 RepID=A0A672J367_SALFA|nr:torsin-2A-like [Salarias fasciatus]XP_029960735.1 torsin-2A-like [Salarias fasciatus]